MKETTLTKHILLALSQAGCTVWRQETAGAWVGKVVYQQGQEVTLRHARHIVFGLCVGSADVIGIAPDGQFLAVEVKLPRGRVSHEQRQFLDAVTAAGGVAGVARSVEDAVGLLP